jgi:hypothetical protein
MNDASLSQYAFALSRKVSGGTDISYMGLNERPKKNSEWPPRRLSEIDLKLLFLSHAVDCRVWVSPTAASDNGGNSRRRRTNFSLSC